MPPPRAAVVLDGLEQQRMETELMAARQQQKTLATAPLEFEPGQTPAQAPAQALAPVAAAPAANPKPAGKPPKAKSAPNVAPAPSSRSIY
jgi:hypothetical protein